MQDTHWLMLLCLLLILTATFQSHIRRAVRSCFSNLEPVIVDGTPFNVLPEYNDKRGAAELLAIVDSDVKHLIRFMEDKYPPSVISSMPEEKKKLYGQIVRRLRSTYKTKSLEETLPEQPKVDVSYNLNKGEVVALCLRDFNTHSFHQKNDIMFVTLHELAHSLNCDESSYQCGSDSYGHTELFWFIFKVLLENAEECGIYKKSNYRESPINYCSMPVTYNPVFDESLSESQFFGSKK